MSENILRALYVVIQNMRRERDELESSGKVNTAEWKKSQKALEKATKEFDKQERDAFRKSGG